MDVMAIDWSGRAEGDRGTIWLAQVRDGSLCKLENGRHRGEIIDYLIDSKDCFERLAVGLDFAFSLPVWFIQRRAIESAYQLWTLVGAGRAVSSEDAFDAAVSALVLSGKASQVESLQKASDPQTALEGSIWRPS